MRIVWGKGKEKTLGTGSRHLEDVGFLDWSGGIFFILVERGLLFAGQPQRVERIGFLYWADWYSGDSRFIGKERIGFMWHNAVESSIDDLKFYTLSVYLLQHHRQTTLRTAFCKGRFIACIKSIVFTVCNWEVKTTRIYIRNSNYIRTRYKQ